MLLVRIVLIFNFVMCGDELRAENSLNVFLEHSHSAPYDIHASGAVLSNVNLLVLGQLIENVNGFDIKPGVLESYKYDYKKDSYLLNLRKDLVFHNGRRANIKDLEFTLLRGFYSSDKSFFHTYLGNISGVRDIKKGERFKSGRVKGVRILDEFTLEIKLNGRNPSLFHSLSAPYFSLVPIEELESDYLTWKRYPIGVGNYKIKKGFDGDKTELVKYNPEAKFESIILYSKKNSDVTFDLSIEKIQNLILNYSRLPFGVRLFEFSNKHKLGTNQLFRKVIRELVNQINVNDSGLSEKTVGILPKHFWGQINEQKGTLDLKKSIKELNLKSLEVIVYSGGDLSEKHLYYIGKIKKVFQEYGVSIEFIPNPEKFVSLETAKKYPLRFKGIVSDYVDPLIMYSAYRKIGHNIHYSPIGSVLERYEELYLKAESARTFEERLLTVKKLNEFSQKNIIQVPIAEEKMVYYINEKTIKSLGDQTSPLTINFEKIVTK